MLTMKMGKTRAFQVYATAFHLICLIVIIREALTLTDGRFIYTLDDPYIHLALAESILAGGYGINPGEFASPSSSILYPLLLAFGLFMGLGELSPLVFSIPFSLASTWLLSGFIWRALTPLENRRVAFGALLLGPAIVLATNAVALPMTGMEHSIHVFATVLALTGLHGLSEDPTRKHALFSVVLGTLLCATIRFEGMALVVGMLGALFSFGLRRQAIMTGLVVLLALASFAITMNLLGLPAFPSSVMTKSNIAAQAGDGDAIGIFAGFIINVWESANSRWGVVLALAAVALVAAASAIGQKTRHGRIFFLVAAFILSAHIVAGKYGWFGRYEVYVVAAMLIGVFAITKAFKATATPSLATILLLIVGAPYIWTTLNTPAASANIYEQQYQMHRFVQEFFPERVAVNDLGFVAFGNDNYVLDLWGLGSEEARQLSANNRWTPELLRQITLRHDITYAMIYTDWVGELPSEWCHVANLVTSQVTSARDTVSFYLIQLDRAGEMQGALGAFGNDLPSGARLEILDCVRDQLN